MVLTLTRVFIVFNPCAFNTFSHCCTGNRIGGKSLPSTAFIMLANAESYRHAVKGVWSGIDLAMKCIFQMGHVALPEINMAANMAIKP
jgi:hypothetical protein